MPRGKTVLVDLSAGSGVGFTVPVSERVQKELGLKANSTGARFSTEKTGKVVKITSTWTFIIAKKDSAKPKRFSITFPGRLKVKDVAQVAATIKGITQFLSPQGVAYDVVAATKAPGRAARGRSGSGGTPRPSTP